ncbi:MAG: hypothetical protein QOG09_1722 [Solirubrobacterales bacterium]|nr:hypothetical protein [Solirubrobacterales bacterium]
MSRRPRLTHACVIVAAVFRYLLGAGELAAVALSLGWGALAVRRTLLPGWSGAPARLAETILAFSALLIIAELLGSVGLFKEIPLLIACVAIGIVAALKAPWPAPDAPPLPPPPRAHPLATAIALAAAFLVVVHWGTFTGFSLDHGMFQSDSTWHNGPFAARFWQTGWTTGLHQTDPLTFMPWFYPQNSELLNAVGLLFLHNDFLTLFANQAWLLLALLAAWCIARPWGAGPAAVLGVLVILDASNMLTSQPGEAKTDLIGIAFLLAAIAILITAAPAGGMGWPRSRIGAKGVEVGRIPSPPLQGEPIEGGRPTHRSVDPGVGSPHDRPRWPQAWALAGLAAGLALGSKYTLIPLAGVLLLALIAIASKGARLRAALWFTLPLLATGAYWYARNLAVAGSPLPQRHLNLAGLHLGTPQLPIDAYPQFSIAHYATDTAVWSTYFRHGLEQTFGPLWWLAIGLAGLGGVLALIRGSGPLIRIGGAIVLIAGLVYVVTPTTAGGLEGMPKAFVYNVRYAVPALALGMALLPVALRFQRSAARWGLLALLFGLLLVTDAPLRAFESRYAAEAVTIALLLTIVPLALALARRRGAPLVPVAAVAIAVYALAVGLGRGEQTDYLKGRYANSYPRSVHNEALAAAMKWAKPIHDRRIGIVGGTASNREYAFFGDRLTNRVQYVGVPGPRGAFYPVHDCETWRRRVDAGRYDYLVLSQRYIPGSYPGARYLPPTGTEAAWTRGDRNAQLVLEGHHIAVFRLRGPLGGRCSQT